MYEKCIKCERLGKDCIPNLYNMSVEEIRVWAKKLKDEKGWSNADLAKASGVPKGTIDSSFSRKSKKDVNYTTFAPILCALIDSDGEMPCYNGCDGFQEIEEENAALMAQVAKLQSHLEENKKDYEERIKYLKDQLRWKRQVVVVLIAVSCIMLTFVLAEVVMDWMNPNVGFFQR